jgi:chromosome segregation ATPase
VESSTIDPIADFKGFARRLKEREERAAAVEQSAARYQAELDACRQQLSAAEGKCAGLEQENTRLQTRLQAWENDSGATIKRLESELRDSRLAADQLEKLVKELSADHRRAIRRAAEAEQRLGERLRASNEQLAWTRDALDAARAEARARIKELREHLELSAEAHERHSLEGARLTRKLKEELVQARVQAADMERRQLDQQGEIREALALLDGAEA